MQIFNLVCNFKEEHLRIKRIANEQNRMVQREFWKNIHKIHKFQEIRKQQQQQYKSQQKKLESFVTKQLKLSSKMANYMKEKPSKPENETDDQNGDMTVEEPEESDYSGSYDERNLLPPTLKIISPYRCYHD